MRILAIDTALEACSCAVLDVVKNVIVASETQSMLRGHAEALMPMIAGLMKASGFKFPDIDRVAVTIGPGSFTGLRVGISAARGIGLAASREVVGVTTLAALAAPLIDEDKSSPVVAAIDARHEHVYLQLFGKDVESTDVPRVALLRDAARAADIAPSRIVGSAATMIENLCSERPLAVCEKRAPDIEWVARLGAVPTNDAPAKPLYLRPPDALPQVAGLVPRR